MFIELMDQQAALGFVRSQTTYVEAEIYRQVLVDILYPSLIPVDFSAPDWIKSVTYVGLEHSGKANWISGLGSDFPTAGFSQSQFETAVYMAGIGYRYSLEEISQASQLGINLSPEKGISARRAYEEFLDDRLIFNGDPSKNFNGLYNYPGVPVNAATTGTWGTATPDQIIGDVNDAIQFIDTNTNSTRLSNTLLLPNSAYNLIASRRLTDTTITILSFLQENNIYTQRTGNRLRILGLHGLDAAGAGSTRRMIAYNNDPRVLKAHIPMPLRFLPPWQESPISYLVPGIYRFGGLDVRYPNELVYVDGI